MTEQEAIDALEEHKRLIDKEYLKTRNSKAIEVVLNMLKEKNEIIEKLQKENEELKNKLLDTLEGQKVIKEETPKYIKENYIPVQKVKAKIEELDIAISECIYLDDDDEEYKKEVEKDKLCLLNQKRALQELLDGSDTDVGSIGSEN